MICTRFFFFLNKADFDFDLDFVYSESKTVNTVMKMVSTFKNGVYIALIFRYIYNESHNNSGVVHTNLQQGAALL